MSAIGAFMRCASACCFLALALMVGCTAKKERESIAPPPVAGPTSTPSQDTPSTAVSDSPATNQPDVPFDGGQPEALGTARPSNAGELIQTPAAVSARGLEFDIYVELWRGTLVCAEDKK